MFLTLLFVLSPVPDYVKATVETVLKIHETEDDGDVLAFLTGQVSGHIVHATQPYFDHFHSAADCVLLLIVPCVFPPQEEVEKVVSLLQEQARTLSRYGMKKHLRILPMYSGLPYAEQMKVFERAPSSVRKVNVLVCLDAFVDS